MADVASLRELIRRSDEYAEFYDRVTERYVALLPYMDPPPARTWTSSGTTDG